MYNEVFDSMHRQRELNYSNSVFIENLISIDYEIDPQLKYLYRAMYSDPIHDKLLTKVVPGLIDQYRGCIHLAKYCMAARGGCVLPDVLHTAESLLKDTLYLDPCSGYVKLACLYIATGDFVQAMSRLNVAENNFLFQKKNMVHSGGENLQLTCVEFERLNTEIVTVIVHDLFHAWAEG